MWRLIYTISQAVIGLKDVQKIVLKQQNKRLKPKGPEPVKCAVVERIIFRLDLLRQGEGRARGGSLVTVSDVDVFGIKPDID